jgi:hypothetical protein
MPRPHKVREKTSPNVAGIEQARADLAKMLAEATAIDGRAMRSDYDWTKEYDHDPTDAEIQAMLPKLSPRQQAYAVHRLRLGRAPARQAMGLSGELTVAAKKWEESPWWPVLIRRELDRLAGNKRATFAPMGHAAQQRLMEEVSGLHGDKLAHDAAVYILDQVHGKPAATTPEGDNAGPDAGEMAGAFVDFIRQATAANAEAKSQALLANVREIPQNASETSDRRAEA